MATDHSMSPEEFRAALAELGFAGDRRENDLGFSAFARFIGKDPRTIITWGGTGPDSTAAVLLRVMLGAKIDREHAEDLLLARGARDTRRKRR